MSIVVTNEAFSKAMHEAVAERGADYVYPQELKFSKPKDEHAENYCLYFDIDEPTKPLCIIGAALARLGVTVEDIYNSNKAHPGTQDVSAFQVLLHLNANYDLAQAAADAQWHQDRGRTWGEALARFDSAMELSKIYKEV